MDIHWYGQSCFRIKGKSSTLVIDPFDPDYINQKLPKDLSAEVVLVSHAHKDHNFPQAVSGDPVIVQGPGEYEVKGVAITGVPAFHDPNNGQDRGKNTVYHFIIDGLNIVHLGDLGHTLTEEQIQEIGVTDILMIPVGGNYTIDAKDASVVVSQLEPRITIPMHYSLPNLKVEIGPLEPFLKEMGVEDGTPQPKLSITKDKLPDEPQVVVLSKS